MIFPAAIDAIIGGCHVANKDLKDKYNEMHSQGPSAWFDDGREERELILKMGEPWDDGYGNLDVLEIGCGEGELAQMIADSTTASVFGVDYAEEAIKKAAVRRKHFLNFSQIDYREMEKIKSALATKKDRIVMQGVLEHLDAPFTELRWMIDNLLVKGGDIITSSPCFLNTRGIVWMTLDMLGAVMSKTDIHFLMPWQFYDFCRSHNYKCIVNTCELSWASGFKMINDLQKRIPLALKDGNIKFEESKVYRFLSFLQAYSSQEALHGAVAVYRIQT